MTFDKLKDVLVEQGWKLYKDNIASDYRYNYYVASKPKYSEYDCTCNDKPPLLWVRFSNMHLAFPEAADSISCEVELTGRIEGDIWPRIQVDIYIEQLIDLEAFDKIERMMCSAWNNMNKTLNQ